MDLVGGRLLGTVSTASQKVSGTGMQVGEIAPISAPARFESAMHYAHLQQTAALGPALAAQMKPTQVQPTAAPLKVAQVGTLTQVAQANPSGVVPASPTATSVPVQPSAQTASGPQTVAEVKDPAAPAGAQDRARRALDLAPAKEPTPATSDGDRILDGLTRLRGVFDTQQGRLINAMNQPVTDANSMIGLQVEVINFSMLVDVASKLTGKTTGALETLMKGQ
jgi:hypothetical protein